MSGPCMHADCVGAFGRCPFCPNPGCGEFQTPGGNFLCWLCGKYIAEVKRRSMEPKGVPS